MRLIVDFIIAGFVLGLMGGSVWAQQAPMDQQTPKNAPAKPMEVTADKTLEWYEDQRVYVARGNAKAVRNTLTVEADLLTAHEREKQQGAKTVKPSENSATAKSSGDDSGDIDWMTADGNVRITDPKSRATGDHAVYDLDRHTVVLTGKNLLYKTEKQTITARDSLEYNENTKIATARGNAVEDEPGRHVEGDVLTAEFHDGPGGTNDLSKVTATDHVLVVTKDNVVRGDRAVYNADSDVALVYDHVHITRADGTQLAGDVGEVDFNTDQSYLLSTGTSRVRALLPPKSTSGASKATSAIPAVIPVTDKVNAP